GRYGYVLVSVPGNPSHTDLTVVDLQTPATPTTVGRVTMPGAPTRMRVVGTLVYAACGGSMAIVDVSSPTAPRIIGSYATSAIASDVAVAGGYAYVIGGGTLDVVRVTTPSLPARVGTLA